MQAQEIALAADLPRPKPPRFQRLGYHLPPALQPGVVELMQSLKLGKNDEMPPLPPETTEEQIKSLVDYLLTLKG